MPMATAPGDDDDDGGGAGLLRAGPPHPPGGLLHALRALAAALLDALVATCARARGGGGGGGERLLVHGRALTLTRPPLAEGGFATVFRAVDVSRQQQYAVKRLLLQEDEQREAVRREVDAHRRFGGGVVAPLVDFSLARGPGAGQDTAYLVLPLYARGSAQDALSRALAAGSSRFFGERDVLRLLSCVADALARLHAGGCAHRDVCPRNVMLADDDGGGAVLIDLGSVAPARVRIASRRDALLLAEEAAVRSSAPYRAPELWEPPPPPAGAGGGGGDDGGGVWVTEASDVYSLGATGYALAFGLAPNESSPSAAGGLRIAEPSHTGALKPLAFPRAATAGGGGSGGGAPAWSPGLLRLLAACLALEPAARPTAQQAADAARALLQQA